MRKGWVCFFLVLGITVGAWAGTLRHEWKPEAPLPFSEQPTFLEGVII